MKSLPTLHLTGTRTEMGHAHGEQFRDRITGLVEARTEVLLGEYDFLTEVHLANSCVNAMRATRRFTPKIYEEISATAEACGIPEWKMIVCGGYTDLLDVFRTFDIKDQHDHSECTTLIQPNAGTISGTWDSNANALESAVILYRQPKDINVSSVCLTTAGWPAQQGVSSAGIAFAINNLMPISADDRGLNYIAANALMAEVESIDQFVEFAERVRFCSGHAYIMVDSKGNGAVVETTVDTISVNMLKDRLVQTNHYISQPLIDDNSGYAFLKGSIDRKKEMEYISNVEVTCLNISSILKSTEYINKSDPDGFVMTCAFFVADAINQKIDLAIGPSTGQSLFSLQI